VFERAKTVHASDREATVPGSLLFTLYKINLSTELNKGNTVSFTLAIFVLLYLRRLKMIYSDVYQSFIMTLTESATNTAKAYTYNNAKLVGLINLCICG
jgi:hypothetical protein